MFHCYYSTLVLRFGECSRTICLCIDALSSMIIFMFFRAERNFSGDMVSSTLQAGICCWVLALTPTTFQELQEGPVWPPRGLFRIPGRCFSFCFINLFCFSSIPYFLPLFKNSFYFVNMYFLVIKHSKSNMHLWISMYLNIDIFICIYTYLYFLLFFLFYNIIS